MQKVSSLQILTLFLALPVVGFIGLDPEDPPPLFVDITESSGIRFQHVNGDPDVKDYIFEAKGGGIGAFDFDNDGWMDILIVQGSTLEMIKDGTSPAMALYRNRGDGTFEDVTERAGLTHRGWGMGVTFGDFDNNGWTDIYLTYLGPDVLYRNNGDGTFTDVTAKSGIVAPGWSTSAAFGDYNGNGYLDLYIAGYLDVGPDNLPRRLSSGVCEYLGQPVMCGPRGLPGARNYLYRNNGDGTFTDVTEESGAADKDHYFGLGVVWADINNNGLLDIVVANDATPNLVFVNNGDGTFEENGFISGLAVSGDGNEQASMGVDLADYDNDGLLDAYFTHFASDYSTLYRNEGDLLFQDVTGAAQVQQPEWPLVSWGTRFVDFNHDGWKDLFHTNGHVYPFLKTSPSKETYFQQAGILYINRKNGTFREAVKETGPDLQKEIVGRGVAFADFDNDGDIDFIIANLNGSPRLFRNDRRDRNNWVMFKTVGTESNRDGIGARISVRTGQLEQIWEVKRTVGIYSASDPRAHFGLGKAERIDSVTVRWPSGKTQEFRNVPANLHYSLHEQEGLREEEIRRH
jgi:enediyne biosynthesis protein E4